MITKNNPNRTAAWPAVTMLPMVLSVALCLAPSLALTPAVALEAADQSAEAADTAPVSPVAETEGSAPLDNDALALALQYDPATLAPITKQKQFGASEPARRAEWSREEKSDGSSVVRVKKPLSWQWDARIGADMALSGTPPANFEPNRPLPGTVKDQPGGSAWAHVAVPDVANVEVRVDPAPDRGKVGAGLQRTIPLGRNYAVTVGNSVAITELYGAPVATPEGLQNQIWDNEKTVKFNILSTGTSFGAGAKNSSIDGITHHQLSAEQRIYGPLRVTGAVTDPGRPTSSQSLTASFKLNW